MSYGDPQALGWRRDAFRASGALGDEVRRRKALEAKCEALERDRDYWKRLAIAALRTVR